MAFWYHLDQLINPSNLCMLHILWPYSKYINSQDPTPNLKASCSVFPFFAGKSHPVIPSLILKHCMVLHYACVNVFPCWSSHQRDIGMQNVLCWMSATDLMSATLNNPYFKAGLSLSLFFTHWDVGFVDVKYSCNMNHFCTQNCVNEYIDTMTPGESLKIVLS